MSYQTPKLPPGVMAYYNDPRNAIRPSLVGPHEECCETIATLTHDLAEARRQLGEVTADRDAILSALQANRGTKLCGYELSVRDVQNGVFVYWLDGENGGGVISLNNLIARARSLAAALPSKPPTE